MPEVITIETPGLGDRSYLAHDGEVGVVVDPQRDIERMMSAASDAGIRITHVLETHIHNDYVTGGYELARAASAAYGIADGDRVGFGRLPVRDGAAISTGGLVLSPMHTPGHTPGHMSYALADRGTGPSAVFTGGSLLFGAVGRTDLIGPDQTEPLTRAQFRSARLLAERLPDSTLIYPTHGFGSFCSATPTSGSTSTIGHQRDVNVALASDEETFVTQLIAGLGPYPRYYAHMDPINRSGPGAPGLEPPSRADAREIRRRIDAAEWVIDLRERRAFAALHVAGAVSVELGDQFATYLGWIVPWGSPLTLLGERPEEIAGAQLQLSRIGIDHVAAAGIGSASTLAASTTASYEVAGFPALAAARREQDLVVLDVRTPQEWRASHMDGSVHIPFWELADRVGEVPEGTVWVHCASGFRASIAASVLQRAGRQVVHVDDDWSCAAAAGLPVVSGA
ncbi:MAG TPA: MBL fold metallo-hydrolase [Trebonia sp.]|jgi:glyoxylase-like metal-dependent hydrolase (beta-lactamase superfamily II)/rhodanese-related sulfurtransferase